MKTVICKDTQEVCHTYREYLQSNHWKKVKQRFWKSKLTKSCACCGTKTNLDLHHLTYKRIGCEKLNDFKLICRSCHNDTHAIHKERNTNKKGSLSLRRAHRRIRTRVKRKKRKQEKQEKQKQQKMLENFTRSIDQLNKQK